MLHWIDQVLAEALTILIVGAGFVVAINFLNACVGGMAHERRETADRDRK